MSEQRSTSPSSGADEPRAAHKGTNLGPATALVIERDEATRWTTRFMLERLGIRALMATDDGHAAEVVDGHPATFDLLLGGLVEDLHRIRSHLQRRQPRPALLRLAASMPVDGDGMPVLCTPFGLNELREAVRAILHPGGRRPES